MNECEFSPIRALGEEFSEALSELRESFRKSLGDHVKKTEEKLVALIKEVSTLRNTAASDFVAQLADVATSLPVPKIPELPGIGVMVGKVVAALSPTQNGKGVTPEGAQPLLQELVTAAASEAPIPRDGKGYDPAVLKQAMDDAVAALSLAQDGKSVTPEDVRPSLQELVTAVAGGIPVPHDSEDYDPAVPKQAVDDTVAALPPTQDGKDVMPEDARPPLRELVTATISEIPVPHDGKDYGPAVLKQAVDDAVAVLSPTQDGKSVMPEDVWPLLQELVIAAASEIPVPRDGKDYDPAVLRQTVDDAVAALPLAQGGRDALQLEIQSFIDEGESYTRGSYTTHNGGLWHACEKAHDMRGWEYIVDGVSGVNISMDGQRNFIITVSRASGASEKKSFDISTMVYRGVFKSSDEYLPGDMVTWDGLLRHCDEQAQDKSGETGSKGWTLAVKRGRGGRGKV